MPGPKTADILEGFQNPRERTSNPMVKVQIKPHESLDKALRRLRKICNNEGITRELKRRSYYEKPSERRRRKERERRKTIRLASRG